jgi:ABC-type branched-subunit amino acid transport system substrate-binding protein
LFGLALAPARAAETRQAPLSEEETLGKALYHHGSATPDRVLRGGVAGVAMPATALACANCHGADGLGGREARVAAPPLRRSDAHGRTTLIDADSIRRALRFPRAGAGMANYVIGAPEIEALAAYLRVLGTPRDLDPGVTDNSVSFGTVLPLSGPLAAAGADVLSVLRSAFEEANAQGGVYGRRIELVVKDSQGTQEGTQAGIAALVESRAVFSLVGSFLPTGSDAAVMSLANAHLPLVGALTPPASPAARASHEIYFLMPGLYDQARALVDYVASQAPAGARVAVVTLDGPAYADGADGALRQVELYPQIQTKRLRLSPDAELRPQLKRFLAESEIDDLIFFGTPASLMEVGQELAASGTATTLLTSILTAGDPTAMKRPSFSNRQLFAVPALGRWLAGKGGGDEAAPAAPSLGTPHVLARSLAFASAHIVIEALKRSGRRLARASFVGQLDSLREHITTVLPPVSFSAQHHVGSTGVYVVAHERSSDGFVPVSALIVPRE